MYSYKELWKDRIASVLNALFKETGCTEVLDSSKIIAENPPQSEMGDIGFPMFSYAKFLRKGPPQIAATVCAALGVAIAKESCQDTFYAEGPYVNIRLDRGGGARAILAGILAENPHGTGGEQADSFGRPETLNGQRIMVEYSSPNTNKPLHLGHLRNDVLGESISRIFEACGADVRRVCIINDRGIHICKSMLAYKKYGQGKTPESEGIKSDRFVGDWYVNFSTELKAQADELVKQGVKKDEAEAQAQATA
jgi:arginyl-tRNA synthetase